MPLKSLPVFGLGKMERQPEEPHARLLRLNLVRRRVI